MARDARRCAAKLDRVVDLGAGLARVDLSGEGVGVGVAPGRFAMVEAPGRPDCILLRPYSYFLAPDADRVSLLIKEVGKGSRALVRAGQGTDLVVLGPLGNRFEEPPASCWAVAGGVGAAPFGAFAGRAGFRILFGARSAAEAGFANALRDVGAELELATDDGSEGFHGTAVDLLREQLAEGARPDAIYTCGPTPMMAAVVAVAREYEVPAWASLEERMGCGIGVCRGCAHRDAGGGWRCICVDGPVYPAASIFAEGAS